MIYLRKNVVDALYKAGQESNAWQDFVNDAVMEKLERVGQEEGAQEEEDEWQKQ